MGTKITFIPNKHVTKDYPPDSIDSAIIATIRMLLKGEVVVWRDSKMYVAGGFACIDGDPIGDIVDATILWFVQYSPANPYKGNWCATTSSIDFLKRRFI